MASRTITLEVGANVTGLINGLRTASMATQNFANRTLSAVERNEAAINGLSNKLGLLGAAGVAAAGVAVKKFADFDQAMSNVAATGEDAKQSIDALREAALEAGARTVFSASEAAGAIEELSKAGVSATDVLGGGLDGALDLAAAGALSVSDAAEDMSVALNQFKLDGSDASHVADLLAAGAGKAMGEVSDLGMALKQGGLVANQTGLSIEETTAALSAFASAGLLGSDAGTSLKTMLQRLTPQSDEAQNQFDALGISAYDLGTGKFVGLSNFAGQLQEKLKDLTPEARNAALAVMFGSDAVRGASVLYDEGATGIQNWISAVDDQGYAADVAATRLDNLKGDLEGLSGAFDTWMINLGEGANGPLRSLVQSATGVVNAFGGLPSGVQNTTLALLGGGGLIAVGTAGFAKLTTSSVETYRSFRSLMTSSPRLANTLKTVGTTAGVAAAALGVFAVALKTAGTGMDDIASSTEMETTLKRISAASGAASMSVDDARVAIDEMVTASGNSGAAINGLDGALKALDANDFLKTMDWIGSFGGLGDSDTKLATQAIEQFDDAITSLATGGAPDEAATALAAYERSAKDAGMSTDKAMGLLPNYSAYLQDEADGATSAGQATDEHVSALKTYSDALAEGGTTTQSYTDALKELAATQQTAAGQTLDVRDAQRGFQQSIDDAAKSLKDNGKTLDIHTQKGRDNADALDAIAHAGQDVLKAQQEQGASEKTLQQTMATTRKAFIDAAVKMGMSRDKAKELADEIHLIPKEIKVQAAVETQRATDALDRWVRLNNGKHVKVTVDAVGGRTYQFTTHGNLAKAAGGPIVGRPGPNDSIHALKELA